MRTAVTTLLLLIVVLGAAGPAQGQVFDVPPGFQVLADTSESPAGEWRGVLTVQPEPGPFSELSAIRLREVVGPVDDADAWLRDRLSADVADRRDLTAALDSPDSPFEDPAFDGLREALPDMFDALDDLAKIPLEFCDGPYDVDTAAGPARELFCKYAVGPFRQFYVLRLQEADGRWYFTEIRAMNERRLRHLIAIANSFHVR